MSGPAVPTGPDELTADWLGRVLGRPVPGLRVTRIGQDEGFTGGGLYRLAFGDGESLVAKLAPSDPALRAAMDAANAREAAFYAGLAGGLPVPRCLHVARDGRSGASVLLLQDLGGLRFGSFLRGLTRGQARAAVTALARIHAARWEAPELAGMSGVDIDDEFPFADYWARYPAALAALLPDFTLSREFRAWGDGLAMSPRARLAALYEAAPLTLLHRDCQADNIAFSPGGAAVLCDWQFAGRGRGAVDVAYLLAGSLSPAARRAWEGELTALYLGELRRRGVRGYAAADFAADYRAAAATKLVATVVATVLLDNAAPAKRAWRRVDLKRLTALAADRAREPAA